MPVQYLDQAVQFPSMSINNSLIPQDLTKEYIESQAASENKPIIKVIKYAKRMDKRPAVYYVEKARLLSVYSLLDDANINGANIIEAAAGKLNVCKKKTVMVMLYCDQYRYDPDSNDSSQAYFVSKFDLIRDKGSWRKNMIEAINKNNYQLVTYFLDKADTDQDLGSTNTFNRMDLLWHSIKMDSVEIYQRVFELTGWAENDGDISHVLYSVACHNSHHVLQYLIDTYPDKMRLMANPIDESFSTPISIAIDNKHEDIAAVILKYTDAATAQRQGLRGRSILETAVIHGLNRTVKTLVDNPLFRDLVESTNIVGLTALHVGLQSLNYPAFKRLYDAYSTSSMLLARCGSEGSTVFHTMIRTKGPTVIKQFIEDVGLDGPHTKGSVLTKGATLMIEADHQGQTPLHLIARIGPYDAIDSLYSIYLQRDALFAKTKEDGFTFFTLLVKGKHADTIKRLVERPDFDPRLVSEVDADGQTPMMWAIFMGCPEICELLYAHAVSTNSLLTKEHDGGHTALMCAVTYNTESVVKLLTNDPVLCSQQMIGGDDGYTPLHWATFRSLEMCTQIYKQAGIKQVCMQTTHHKLTALHIAVLYRSVDVIRVLLKDQAKAKALIWILDADGKTALDYAWMRSRVMAEVIFQAGAPEHRQLVLPHINFASLSLLHCPGTPRSELILFKHSGELPINILGKRTRQICSIDEESISSRIDDLDRM